MQYREITEKIIGCAFAVYNQMGSDYLESVYERCMLIELRKAGLCANSQQKIKVFYDNQIVGEFKADIIVELKAVSQITKIHEAQLVNYPVSIGKNVGLLINFGSEKVQVRRKVKSLEGS